MQVKSIIFSILLLSAIILISSFPTTVALAGAPKLGVIDSGNNLMLTNDSLLVKVGEKSVLTVDSVNVTGNSSAFSALAVTAVTNGSFQLAFTPTGIGSYQFKAVWVGNSAYNGADSTVVSVTAVTPPLQLSDYWLYYVIAILGIVFVAILVVNWRTRK